MLSKEFINLISFKIDRSILEVRSISGGDISSVFCLITPDEKYILKVNSHEKALQMFFSEQYGLDTISRSKTIMVPNVIACATHNDMAYIILEYIEPKRPDTEDFNRLGTQLARLHDLTSNNFGLEQHNFIGSLDQSNAQYSKWSEFFINERLKPQFKLAQKKKLLDRSDIPPSEIMIDIGNQFFQNIRPSLLHGDLWSGNYLISTNGVPYLIDPAIYFGHHEVDIAMSKLFGGFDRSFYEAYHEIIPYESGTDQRSELYQLYYLLVHLNLFGRSYYNSVKRILNRYFSM